MRGETLKRARGYGRLVFFRGGSGKATTTSAVTRVETKSGVFVPKPAAVHCLISQSTSLILGEEARRGGGGGVCFQGHWEATAEGRDGRKGN